MKNATVCAYCCKSNKEAHLRDIDFEACYRNISSLLISSLSHSPLDSMAVITYTDHLKSKHSFSSQNTYRNASVTHPGK